MNRNVEDEYQAMLSGDESSKFEHKASRIWQEIQNPL